MRFSGPTGLAAPPAPPAKDAASAPTLGDRRMRLRMVHRRHKDQTRRLHLHGNGRRLRASLPIAALTSRSPVHAVERLRIRDAGDRQAGALLEATHAPLSGRTKLPGLDQGYRLSAG